MYGIAVEDLLKLDVMYEEDTMYDELLAEFVPVTSCNQQFKHERVSIRHYMNDRCNDCRSRTVEIVFLGEVAVACIQYLGRGDYDNLEILNKEAYRELLGLIFESAIENKVNSISDEQVTRISISAYGESLDVVDNVLTAFTKPSDD